MSRYCARARLRGRLREWMGTPLLRPDLIGRGMPELAAEYANLSSSRRLAFLGALADADPRAAEALAARLMRRGGDPRRARGGTDGVSACQGVRVPNSAASAGTRTSKSHEQGGS